MAVYVHSMYCVMYTVPADVMKMMKKTFSIPEEKKCRVWYSGTDDDFTLFTSMDTSLHNFAYPYNFIQVCVV